MDTRIQYTFTKQDTFQQLKTIGKYEHLLNKSPYKSDYQIHYIGCNDGSEYLKIFVWNSQLKNHIEFQYIPDKKGLLLTHDSSMEIRQYIIAKEKYDSAILPLMDYLHFSIDNHQILSFENSLEFVHMFESILELSL